MKVLISLILLVSTSFIAEAQLTHARQTFSNGGSVSSSTNGLNASYTLGEALTGTVTTSSITATQGFQQSEDTSGNSAVRVIVPEISISVYPNPISSELNVNILSETLESGALIIFDPSGKEIINKSLSNNELGVQTINTESLTAGLYFLNIVDQNGNSIAYHKLLKQ